MRDVGRFGLVPIAKDMVYWFAVINAAQGQKDEGDVQKNLLEAYRNFHPIVSRVIEHTSKDKIMRHDLYDLKRIAKWSKGNIGLLGDAAHATTPNMGQGACQGIEDAYYLSHLLAKHGANLAKAFSVFEKVR